MRAGAGSSGRTRTGDHADRAAGDGLEKERLTVGRVGDGVGDGLGGRLRGGGGHCCCGEHEVVSRREQGLMPGTRLMDDWTDLG